MNDPAPPGTDRQPVTAQPIPVDDIPGPPVEYGPITVRPARLDDGEAIQRILTYWADRGDLLHRSLGEIYEHIREFKVAEASGQVVGCTALHIFGPDLAEIRSIAVMQALQGRAVGAALAEACIDEAHALGIRRVFALTYRPGFFEKLGFRVANVMEFPQKVWSECVRCPFFTNCREVAVVRELASETGEPLD